MKKVSVLLILISCFAESYSQFLNPRNFNESVTRRFNASIYNAAELFDSCEIKDRNIKSAALLDIYDGTVAGDTLYIYYFDSTGRAIAQVSFTAPSEDDQGDSYIRDKECDLNGPQISEEENNDRYFVINYTPYGLERRLYSSINNEMLDSEFIVTRNCGEAYVQTNGRAELIAYPIQDGSSLIGKIVSIQIDEDYYATQYVIKYQ